MGSPTDGILLIDKCTDETSYGVVKKVKFALRCGNRIKVGHAGTLDPFATGLLIVLLGQGAKLSQFIMPGEKVYLATVQLGVATDTLDPTGKMVATAPVPHMSLEHVRETAKRFVGKLHQVPPAYSAVRYQGKRAYELARKGQSVELRAREITVHSLDVLSMTLPEITVRIRCSSGTYIRTLASDLGDSLGTVAHLRSLRRIRSGPFDVEDALSSAAIGDPVYGPVLFEKVIPMRQAIPHMEEIRVSAGIAEKVRHGLRPSWEELVPGGDETGEFGLDVPAGRFKLVSDGGLVAIVEIEPGEGCGRVGIERVFLS